MLFPSFPPTAGGGTVAAAFIALAAAAIVVPATSSNEVRFVSRELKSAKASAKFAKKKKSSKKEDACLLAMTESEQNNWKDLLGTYFIKPQVSNFLVCPTVVDKLTCDGTEYLNPCFAEKAGFDDPSNDCTWSGDDPCFTDLSTVMCGTDGGPPYEFPSKCYAAKIMDFADTECDSKAWKYYGFGPKGPIDGDEDPVADLICKQGVGHVVAECSTPNDVADCVVACIFDQGLKFYNQASTFSTCVPGCGESSDTCKEMAQYALDICFPSFDPSTVAPNFLNNKCLIEESCPGYVCRPGTNPAEGTPYKCGSEFGFPCISGTDKPDVDAGPICPEVCCCESCVCYFDCSCNESIECPPYTSLGGLFGPDNIFY